MGRSSPQIGLRYSIVSVKGKICQEKVLEPHTVSVAIYAYLKTYEVVVVNFVTESGNKNVTLNQKEKLPKKIYNHSPEGRAYQRHHNLKRLGWIVEMWEQTLLEQGNVCALCREPFSKTDRPCADHAHTDQPKPRGVLHSSCNKAIGMFKENPEKCRKAAEYIEAWM